MARVVFTGALDEAVFAFVKNEAEKAERNPRYVPKKIETPAFSVVYNRIGESVKAIIVEKISPILIGINYANALPIVPRLPEDILAMGQGDEYAESKAAIYAQTGSSEYLSRRTELRYVNGLVPELNTHAVVVSTAKIDVEDGGYTYKRKIETYDAGGGSEIERLSITMDIHAAHDYEVGTPSFEDPEDYGTTRVVTYEIYHDMSLQGLESKNYKMQEEIYTHVDKYAYNFYYSNAFGSASTPINVYEYRTDGVTREVEIKSNFIKTRAADLWSYMSFAAIDKSNFSAKTKSDVRPSVAYVGDSSGYKIKCNQQYFYDPREVGFFGGASSHGIVLYENLMNPDFGGKDSMSDLYLLELTANATRGGTLVHPFLNSETETGFEYDSSKPMAENQPKSYAEIEFENNNPRHVVAITTDCIGDVYHVEFGFSMEPKKDTWEYGRFVEEDQNNRTQRIWHKVRASASYNLFKNGEFVKPIKTLSEDDINPESYTHYAFDWFNVNDARQFSSALLAASLRNGAPFFRILGGSLEPGGGVVAIFDKSKYTTFTLSALAGSFAATKAGIFAIGRNETKREDCVFFIESSFQEDGVQVIELDSDDSGQELPAGVHAIKPHKSYKKELSDGETRFTNAVLFVREKASGDSGRRCFISFDDGKCIDLTDFAESLSSGEPGFNPAEWDGAAFQYSPIEKKLPPDENGFNFQRRVKKSYAPQWLRAYYEYEDDQATR